MMLLLTSAGVLTVLHHPKSKGFRCFWFHRQNSTDNKNWSRLCLLHGRSALLCNTWNHFFNLPSGIHVWCESLSSLGRRVICEKKKTVPRFLISEKPSLGWEDSIKFKITTCLDKDSSRFNSCVHCGEKFSQASSEIRPLSSWVIKNSFHIKLHWVSSTYSIWYVLQEVVEMITVLNQINQRAAGD